MPSSKREDGTNFSVASSACTATASAGGLQDAGYFKVKMGNEIGKCQSDYDERSENWQLRLEMIRQLIANQMSERMAVAIGNNIAVDCQSDEPIRGKWELLLECCGVLASSKAIACEMIDNSFKR